MRKIHTFENKDNGRTSVVYRNSEWDEYEVRFYLNGKYWENADYHTDDKQDALSTAEHFIKG